MRRWENLDVETLRRISFQFPCCGRGVETEAESQPEAPEPKTTFNSLAVGGGLRPRKGPRNTAAIGSTTFNSLAVGGGVETSANPIPL